MRRGFRRRGAGAYVAAFVAFALAALLWFHSSLLHPGVRVPGGFSDETSSIRQVWAISVQHGNPFNFKRDALTGAPEGLQLAPALEFSNGALQTAFVWTLKGPLGLIGAWNAFLFLGFVASGLAMFAFLDRLGCTFSASLFGGYLFAFNPYTLERAVVGHLGYLQNWVFVGLVGALMRMRSSRSWRAALVVGLVLGLSFYVGAYDALFAGFMTAVFVVVELARLPHRRERLRSGALGAGALVVSLACVSPVIVLYQGEQSVASTQIAHAGRDFYHFAASLRDYAIPSPRNPFFHWVRSFHPRDLTEHTLFFGYTSWALAVAGVIMLRRRHAWFRATEMRWWTSVYLAVLVPAAVVMSLPPSYTFGKVVVPTPSLALAIATNFWRVYSRFGVIVLLGVAALASLALSALAERRAAVWRFLAPAALLVVALFELLPGNVAAFDTKARPVWISWLAAQPNGIVATYPIALGGANPAFDLSQEDFYYQRFDGHPRFALFGLSALGVRTRANSIRLLARDVSDPLTPRVLATEGVRYVIVHDDVYRAQGQPVPRLAAPAFVLLRRFEGVRAYSVHAARVDLTAALRAHRRELARLEGITPPKRR